MLEEDVRMLEMIQPRQQGTKKRRKPKVSRVKKKETTVTTAANGDVNMLQVETTGEGRSTIHLELAVVLNMLFLT